MRRVLLLNVTYEPLTTVGLRRAVCLVLCGKAEVVHDSGGQVLHSATVTVAAPSVIRLRRYIRIPHRNRVPLTRAALMRRDNYKCAYCSRHAETIDHIIPRSRGGQHTWENCVASCQMCNHRKADRMLEELGWELLNKPVVPRGAHWRLIGAQYDGDPAWETYLGNTSAALSGGIGAKTLIMDVCPVHGHTGNSRVRRKSGVMNGSKKSSAEASGIIQATILKKCDRTGHRPETNKGCAAGTCQHTCEPGQVEQCPHKWTVRYSVNSRQREGSFATLTEARVFQAELSTKKVTQGALFTDPRAGARKLGDIRREYTARLDISADTLEVYERNYRGSGAQEMFDALPVATVARMEAEVDTLVNTTHLKKSRVYRANVLRMVQGTLDLAVRRHVIPGHQVVGIDLKTYRPNAEEWAARNAPWVFVTDEQVRQLADGITITATDAKGRARRRTLKGLGVAAWLMRCCGARIGEALGAHKADFVQRDDGARVWQLRWQAADDGHSQVAIKHRPAGGGRDIPVPDFIWHMIQALPDGPVCPGATGRTRYMSYVTAAGRLSAVAGTLGIDPGWHAHNLRHQFASEEAATGANIADLSETLGHQSPDVTFRRYVRSMPGRLDRMADRMNARWAKPTLRAAA